jgi:hypothetical protein
MEKELKRVAAAIWFDYERQAWVESGKYVKCGHPDSMNCGCYGKRHEGERVEVKEDEK